MKTRCELHPMARDAIVAAAKELGSPTEGEFASSLWLMCSGHWGIDVAQATKLYEDCGYVPFKGFPLTKAGEEQKVAA